MNVSPFIINGDLRRQEKKRLSLMKYFVRNFWIHEDVNRVYGGGMSDEECENIIQDKQKEINILEKKLAQTK